MPQVNVVGGYDGVSFPPGTTNQSTAAGMDIGAALESSGGAGGQLQWMNPGSNGYLAWTVAPEDAQTPNMAQATTVGWLTRIFAVLGGPCGHLDLNVGTGTFTNAVFAIYSAASFATGPLVWTADQHTAMVAGASSVTWNGTNSPASVNLVAGQTYWIYAEYTGTAPTVSGCTMATASLANANLTASATNANNVMTLAAGAPTTLAANTTLTPQTSWANTNLKAWYGLRA